MKGLRLECWVRMMLDAVSDAILGAARTARSLQEEGRESAGDAVAGALHTPRVLSRGAVGAQACWQKGAGWPARCSTGYRATRAGLSRLGRRADFCLGCGSGRIMPDLQRGQRTSGRTLRAESTPRRRLEARALLDFERSNLRGKSVDDEESKTAVAKERPNSPRHCNLPSSFTPSSPRADAFPGPEFGRGLCWSGTGSRKARRGFEAQDSRSNPWVARESGQASRLLRRAATVSSQPGDRMRSGCATTSRESSQGNNALS